MVGKAADHFLVGVVGVVENGSDHHDLAEGDDLFSFDLGEWTDHDKNDLIEGDRLLSSRLDSKVIFSIVQCC